MGLRLFNNSVNSLLFQDDFKNNMQVICSIDHIFDIYLFTTTKSK